MARRPSQTDPQYPFLSDRVGGSALVETPNGIARDIGMSPDQQTLGAHNEKGIENAWGRITTRRATDDAAKGGNRTGE
jgi:hypothetical protein